MKFQKINPLNFPLSDEQREVSFVIMNGQSCAVPSCAGSGKSHTSRAIAMNYNGMVNSIPFSTKGEADEIERYKGFNNIYSMNFHKRGKRLCSPMADVDTRKCAKIALQIDGENAEAIAALTRHFKCEAIGIWDNALTIEQVAIKYGIDTKFIPNALECLAQSDKMTNVIDLDDMLRHPVLLGRQQIVEGLIILDEVQDYTPASWMFLSRCLTLPTSHVLMIGDPERQCLMSFAGASAELFNIMANHYGCEIRTLTVNRRCSKAVIENAPFKGDMQALPDAPNGEVGTKVLREIIEAVANGSYGNDAILSEANAPLVTLGLQLLTKGIPVQMRMNKLDKLITRHCFKYLDTRKFQVGTMADMLRKETEASAADGEERDDISDVIKCVDALETYCLSKGIV